MGRQASFHPNLHCNRELPIYVFFECKFSWTKVENSTPGFYGDVSSQNISDEAIEARAIWRVKLKLFRKFRIWSKLPYMVIF